MPFFVCSLTREELWQGLLTAHYGRLNIYSIYSYSTFRSISFYVITFQRYMCTLHIELPGYVHVCFLLHLVSHAVSAENIFRDNTFPLMSWTIGHFRVLLCLCVKTSLSAKPFIWKWILHACSFIFMQIKVIFVRMVSHLDSLWNRGTRELGN